ncbi:beta-lactamase domain-containing protein [Thermodesulfobium narugense DSM 14796]|uniref:Beta-lactamase domain-containing protein n=1 Tax=Thermodesulfobium narugense DSM 14796 TaxID=747365 RepID=M1E844_9BACT|nr:MBL fold metallo-hydrolase [Thermodesulfobium narugense]AEE14750.1 beta-lactamase domain-containing protein [Thermodesulfobium narugense DSM 14796]
MQLIYINDRLGYIKSNVNIGFLLNEKKEAILIDAGIDDDNAKKAFKILDAEKIIPKKIIITHAHADHFGGASWFVKHLNTEVLSTLPAKSILEYPLMEPIYLFCGANPPKILHQKFFLGKKINVDKIVDHGKISFENINFEIVELPGHSFGQIGILFENYLFSADSFISYEFLAKHKIPLNSDIKGTLQTLNFLKNSKFKGIIPSHGDLFENYLDVLNENERIINQILEFILDICFKEVSEIELLNLIYDKFNITIKDMATNVLMRLSILAYISYLLDENLLRVEFVNNQQFFVRVS